ncbi:MAG: NAD(+) kinase [Proteobacteria bacterium]|nr:MAG: NAD(+) kinase [Pseudomonadota bacterium]
MPDSYISYLPDFTVTYVGIITKKGEPTVLKYAEKLEGWLSRQGIASSRDIISPDLDILIILGGDGTLLHVAETAARYSIPVLGINLGNLGFLTELTESETEPALLEILTGPVTVENRLMLKTRLLTDNGAKNYRFALNDVVIHKKTLDRLLNLSTKANDDYINTYKADGLIFSTPTGSTAYSLSAGGPLVHPELTAILVTPICPFMLSSRPVILPPNKLITSELLGNTDAGKTMVIIDGQSAWEMTPGDILEIQSAEQPLQLILSTKSDYFTVLRDKLKWGSNN